MNDNISEQNEDIVGGYELAERMTGVGRSTLYTWVHKNIIPHIRISSRMVRFSRTELIQWLNDRKVNSKPRYAKELK